MGKSKLMPFGFGKKKKLDKDALHAEIIAALKEVYDPEIPVNIYDLGLIYDVKIDDKGNVDVDMTLTTPGCPVAVTFPGIVERAVCEVDTVNSCTVELVWDPPWTQECMTEAAKLQLGLI
jgi:FeS assembly SUF system protein